MGLRIAELETLFTADIRNFQAGAGRVEQMQRALGRTTPEVAIGADAAGALAAIARVQEEARRLGIEDIEVPVGADAAAALAALSRVQAEARRLGLSSTELTISADDSAALAALSRVQAETRQLGGEGAQAGEDAGKGLSAGIIGALATIPIAGAVVGIGVAIGKSLMDGLQVEVRSDELMAKTGLDAKSVAIIARASGEAYAANFGESLAGNMDTARVAIQGGLLDPKGTARDSQAIIQSLSGVSQILGEEIPAVSRSTAQLLRTGLAKDAASAFDLIVKGSQAGLNVSEDFLDTIDEYSTQFSKLGLDGPQAFGLLSQAVKGGARDTDTAADAIKEFAIRAVDGSTTTKAGFEAIGQSAAGMSAAIAKGGPEANAALGLTLQSLRDMEPGAARTAAAVALFGTKAEDMGNALYSMDLSTAVAQLGSVEGAAKTALATLGDNAAGSIATAQRNIEVAADGIKGALATAFSPQIEGFATFVTENREAVMQFLLDVANGGIDAARAMVNGTADMTEAIGGFIAGPAADLLVAIGGIVVGMDHAMPGDQGGAAFNKWAMDAADAMRGVGPASQEAADAIRKNLIENGLDPAQAKLNAVAIPLVAQAALHDASVSLAGDIDAIGYAADGTRLGIDTLSGAVNTGTAAGALLDQQIRTMVGALGTESATAAAAGETQDQLNARYEAGRVSLVNQLVQMGYTGAQAEALAAQYGAVPTAVATAITADAGAASATADLMRAKYDGLGRPITTVATLIVSGYESARAKYDGLGRPITTVATVVVSGYEAARAKFDGLGRPLVNGGAVHAANGRDRQSMIAPGGANILWAEPETGWETYISGKPSQRARNVRLLTETARRFGLAVLPANTKAFAGGGSSSPAGSSLTGLAGAGPRITVQVVADAGLAAEFGYDVARKVTTRLEDAISAYGISSLVGGA